MNHVTSSRVEQSPGNEALETVYAESSRDSGQRRKSLLFTVLVIVLTFAGAVPLSEYARVESSDYFMFFLATLGLAVFFQRYHEAHRAGRDISVAILLKQKAVAWGATFLFATLVLVLTDLRDMPRVLSISVIAVSCVLDIVVATVSRRGTAPSGDTAEQIDPNPNNTSGSLSYRNLIVSLLVLAFSFVGVMVVKADGVTLYSHYEQLIVVIVTSWLLAAVATRAFNARSADNIFFRLAPVWKLGYVTALLVSVFYLYGDFEHLSRAILFGTVLLFTVTQVLIVIVKGRLERTSGTESQVALPTDTDRPDQPDPEVANTPRGSGFLLDEHLPNQVALDGRADLQEFLNRELPLTSAEKVSILFSSDREDLRQLSQSTKVLINLEALNLVEHLNPYLASIHKRLRHEGYFVTWFYPIDTMANRVRSQMPKSIFVVFYPLYFFVFRIAAKLPPLDKIIFHCSRGRQPAISRAEVLGRLAFSGFSVLQSRTINQRVYVVARADRAPVEGVEPSFGPIAKLERIGLHGEKITIYKIRTMYPYSEFIQKDVFGANGMGENGKFMNDFRITSLGRVMRKYWVDELPQLYNWLRGDIALVGVRAISRHYFSLYSKEMQALRLRARPGLIPPLYADMPRTFTEIVDSERRYILERERRPVSTDLKYLVKAVYNIFFKGARSA